MILAMNTAFLTANLGLIKEDGTKYEKCIDAKSKHSENVLKTIDELLNQAKANINEVDKVAVVVGPGSFTGVRIGVAIVKGMGAVNEKLKVYPVSSLELMAYIYSQKHKKDFVCVLNALSNLFFVCEFDKNGIKQGKERMIDRETLDAINLGKVCLENDLELDGAEYVEITTSNLLDFAELLVSKNEWKDAQIVEPVYIRPSQAEANLKSNKNV